MRQLGSRMGPLATDRKGGKVEAKRLLARSVANIIKAHVEAVGLDPTIFSGHSLRSGFVTSALQARADSPRNGRDTPPAD